MKRAGLVIALVATTMLLVASGAGGHPPTAGQPVADTKPPEILLARWDARPRAGVEAVLRVIAHDPDGVISDVAVWWGDRSFEQATTYCVEATSPGEPARVLLAHNYTKPGTYAVRVQVASYPACDATDVEHELSKKARWKVLVKR